MPARYVRGCPASTSPAEYGPIEVTARYTHQDVIKEEICIQVAHFQADRQRSAWCRSEHLHKIRRDEPVYPGHAEVDLRRLRVEHHMLELVATTPVKELEAKGAEWATELLSEVRKNDAENVLESSYISLLDNDDSDYRKIYGAHYKTLVALKKKYDPSNVFKYAVPRLSI